jgi:stage IV sporulation protein FB
MIRFKIFGIPVTVELWFWLTMAFIGGGLRANSTEALLRVALFVLAGFVSILIHELGHALTIRKFGLPTQITLTTFGGYATHPAGILSRTKSFIVTAAGPAIQIVFGLLVGFIYINTSMPSENIGYFVEVLALISIIWAIFNCLPIFPLDGGQMLASILGPRRAKILHMTGIICALIIGLIGLKFGYMLVLVFMGLFAWQNYQMLQQNR